MLGPGADPKADNPEDQHNTETIAAFPPTHLESLPLPRGGAEAEQWRQNKFIVRAGRAEKREAF